MKWTGFRSGCVGGGPRENVFVPRVGEVCRCEAFAVIVKAASGEDGGGGRSAVFTMVLGSWAYGRLGDRCGDPGRREGEGGWLYTFVSIPGSSVCGRIGEVWREEGPLVVMAVEGRKGGGRGYVYAAGSGRGREVVAVCRPRRVGRGGIVASATCSRELTDAGGDTLFESVFLLLGNGGALALSSDPLDRVGMRGLELLFRLSTLVPMVIDEREIEAPARE